MWVQNTHIMKSILTDFLSLIYPELCYACGQGLLKQEKCLCTFCKYHLPKTEYHRDEHNPISKLFWGRVNIHSAAAFYHFEKGGKVQALIHHLKYKGREEIGTTLGNSFGRELRESMLYKGIDIVLPVPLHPKRLKQRGYNQSDSFAKGLAQGLNAEFAADKLCRIVNTSTQTYRSRFDRWTNMHSVFGLRSPNYIDGAHVLLADDVITTGSTLEACAEVLHLVPNVKVSIAAIASAKTG